MGTRRKETEWPFTEIIEPSCGERDWGFGVRFLVIGLITVEMYVG